MPPLFIGTSAFTAAGWDGTFYPMECARDGADASGHVLEMGERKI
jgi:hypothetical protein